MIGGSFVIDSVSIVHRAFCSLAITPSQHYGCAPRSNEEMAEHLQRMDISNGHSAKSSLDLTPCPQCVL